MRFIAHASSSAANFYEIIASNGDRLLIDCGLTWGQMLRKLNYNLENIVGLCLDHQHFDHSKSVEYVLDNGIDVYASEETFHALGIQHRKVKFIRDLERFYIKDFCCIPFALRHDVPCMGFVIQADGESLLFITDTFMVKQKFALEFSIISICCNYDKEILQERVDSGDINETFAKRLLTSHMEKEVAKSYIRDCCNLSKCTEIWLLHMSMKNADKEKIRKEFEDAFFIKTFIAGKVTRTS